jgi:hypothetical protein
MDQQTLHTERIHKVTYSFATASSIRNRCCSGRKSASCTESIRPWRSWCKREQSEVDVEWDPTETGDSINQEDAIYASEQEMLTPKKESFST